MIPQPQDIQEWPRQFMPFLSFIGGQISKDLSKNTSGDVPYAKPIK